MAAVTFRFATGILLLTVALALVPLGRGHATTANQPRDGGSRVLVTDVDGAITPVVADHLSAGLERAAGGGYAAYLLVLDTPGGLVTSMRDIVTDILASPVPVIVYVSPDGARAASAGAVITLAAHVAIMAPGTTIGAATPVDAEGGDVERKVVSDAAAQAVALAELRGRDVGFAADMVREGRSAAVEEALRLGVVDARAVSVADALAVADGREVAVAGDRRAVVATDGAELVRHDFGPLQSLLQVLANPTLAYLLLTVGVLGLLFELVSPGLGVAGAVGGLSLVLGLFGVAILPVTAVGVILLLAAAALFAAELFAPGFVGFALGGVAALGLAAVFLIDDAAGVSVDLSAALPTAVLVGALVVLAGRLVLRSQRRSSARSGADALVNRRVSVRDTQGTVGRAFVEGAWWRVRSAGPPLCDDSEARVLRLDGLDLIVDPTPEGKPQDD